MGTQDVLIRRHSQYCTTAQIPWRPSSRLKGNFETSANLLASCLHAHLVSVQRRTRDRAWLKSIPLAAATSCLCHCSAQNGEAEVFASFFGFAVSLTLLNPPAHLVRLSFFNTIVSTKRILVGTTS